MDLVWRNTILTTACPWPKSFWPQIWAHQWKISNINGSVRWKLSNEKLSYFMNNSPSPWKGLILSCKHYQHHFAAHILYPVNKIIIKYSISVTTCSRIFSMHVEMRRGPGWNVQQIENTDWTAVLRNQQLSSQSGHVVIIRKLMQSIFWHFNTVCAGHLV